MYRVKQNAVFGYQGKRYELGLTEIMIIPLGGTKDAPPSELIVYPPTQEVLEYLYNCGSSLVEKVNDDDTDLAKNSENNNLIKESYENIAINRPNKHIIHNKKK